MNAVRTILPLALAAYFIYMGTRSRIFLLGIPFLMFMRSSVFFENARVFWIPGRFSGDTHVVIWLVLVWLVCTDLLLARRRGDQAFRPFGRRLSAPEEILVLLAIGYGALQVGLTVIRYGDVASALGEAQGFLYLFAGYFLMRGIVSTSSIDEILSFVRALVVINTGAAVLFILHQAADFSIYAGAEYYTTTFMGVTITRTFYFMPQLLPLSIAYIFARRQWNVWMVVASLINLTAVWVSYTRSLVLIAILIIAVTLIARALKGSQAGLVLRRATAIGLVLAAMAVGFTQLFPVQSEYFMARLSEASAAPSVAEIANVQNRQQKVEVTYRSIARNDATLGAGWVSAAEEPMADQVERMQADIVWVPVLFRLGVLGVVMWIALFAAFAWRAAWLASRPDPNVEVFGIIWLGIVVGLFLEGFVSWTFLQPGRHAMALWAFAFLGAVASMVRSSSTGADETPMKEA